MDHCIGFWSHKFDWKNETKRKNNNQHHQHHQRCNDINIILAKRSHKIIFSTFISIHFPLQSIHPTPPIIWDLFLNTIDVNLFYGFGHCNAINATPMHSLTHSPNRWCGEIHWLALGQTLDSDWCIKPTKSMDWTE